VCSIGGIRRHTDPDITSSVIASFTPFASGPGSQRLSDRYRHLVWGSTPIPISQGDIIMTPGYDKDGYERLNGQRNSQRQLEKRYDA
jgi:hypothetical protein